MFLSQVFVILLIIFGCFWRNHLSKTCDGSTVCVGILCSAAGYILTSPRLWTSYFTFLSTFPTSLRCCAEGNSKSRVCAWSKLWIHWFVKKPRYKVLVNIDESCEEICNSKAFVDIAIAGRHRGLSTFYFKHKLFQQSKLGRNLELQNTHIVLYRSSRDVMQVNALSTQLVLGSELVDWYRDATSVPFGHLLIDLSPRTDDRLRYCTNTGSSLSKFYIPDRLKESKILDDEHTNFLYSPSVLIIFPQKQKSFPSVLPKWVYPVSLRMHNKPAQRRPAKHKKTSRGKILKRGSTIVSKTYNLQAKKRLSSVRKRVTAL